MTSNPDGDHPSSIFSRLRDLVFRPFRRRVPDIRPQRDLGRETVRIQVGVIRRAFGDKVGVATNRGGDDADAEYLYRPEHILIRTEDLKEVGRFFSERQDTFRGTGEVVGEPLDDLALYRLPPRLQDGAIDVLQTLDEMDREVRAGLATPDHILYVTVLGRACPATEPELPPRSEPLPTQSKDPGAGKGVRVSVVDTGWYPGAATDADSPWLGAGVDGDVETVDPTNIHPYAGHGTFVSGVVRCLAPATEIEVEGFLTKGGAIYESEIAEELNEALRDSDEPQLISISAGTHTRRNLPLMGFQALADAYRLKERDDGPLVVAAAGNDGNDVPFYPAAFDWVVSVGALDAVGKKSDFSNYGKWVDVYAHGRDLVNAFPTGTYTCHEPAHLGEVRNFTGLAQWSGTSFSTPIVTGAIAAYMSEHGVSARDARDALLAAAVTKVDPTAGSISAVGPPFV